MRRRGTTSERGYDRDHQRRREEWRAYVEAGMVACWRCGKPIHPREPWDLGHDDFDRSKYKGPEHRACNRATKRNGQRDPEPLVSQWWASNT